MAYEDQSDNGGSDENEVLAPVDPEADPLRWLDDGLPDLSGFKHRYFDPAAQFDISRYIQEDSVSESDGTPVANDFTRNTLLSGAGKNYGRTKTRRLISHLQTMSGGNGRSRKAVATGSHRKECAVDLS
jgi:hypothetical protein